MLHCAALKSIGLFFNGRQAFAKVFPGSSLDIQVLPNFYSRTSKITNVALLQFVANVAVPVAPATHKPTRRKTVKPSNKIKTAVSAAARSASGHTVDARGVKSFAVVRAGQRAPARRRRPPRLRAHSQNPNCKRQTTWLRFT